MGTLSILAAVVLVVVIVATVMYFAFPATLFRWLVAIGRRAARLEQKTIEVNDVPWPYLEGGPAHGETLLLVHGFGAEKDHWLAYARYFSKRFRVVIPDLPGFGEGTRCADLDYGVDAQAHRLDEFLEALGVSHCHACGNSMGGYILLKLALANPQRLSSMTLLDNAGVTGANQSDLIKAAARGENLLRIESSDDVDRVLAFATHRPPWIPGRFKQLIADQAISHIGFLDKLFQRLSSQLQDSPMNDQLADVSVPTLVIWGKHDRLVDVSCVTILEQRVPACESIIFDDVGHMPMIEAPARTAGHHLAFLGRLNSQTLKHT